MPSITTLLFPSSTELLLEEITREEQTLIVSVGSSSNAVACPRCLQPAMRVHSRYTRTLADVPCMEDVSELRTQKPTKCLCKRQEGFQKTPVLSIAT
jgi:hypothetical protein